MVDFVITKLSEPPLFVKTSTGFGTSPLAKQAELEAAKAALQAHLGPLDKNFSEGVNLYLGYVDARELVPKQANAHTG